MNFEDAGVRALIEPILVGLRLDGFGSKAKNTISAMLSRLRGPDRTVAGRLEELFDKCEDVYVKLALVDALLRVSGNNKGGEHIS